MCPTSLHVALQHPAAVKVLRPAQLQAGKLSLQKEAAILLHEMERSVNPDTDSIALYRELAEDLRVGSSRNLLRCDAWCSFYNSFECFHCPFVALIFRSTKLRQKDFAKSLFTFNRRFPRYLLQSSHENKKHFLRNSYGQH